MPLSFTHKMNHCIDSDQEFDLLFPKEISKHSSTHWSSIGSIKIAIDWLKDQKNILDIGSGNGKFCIIGSQLLNSNFTGVEIRKELVEASNQIAERLKSSTKFIHEDIKNIQFSTFDAFYYYNPFCEHLCLDDAIDDQIQNSDELFDKYETIIGNKLALTKIGTKVVCQNNDGLFMPSSFEITEIDDINEKMVLWQKIK